MLVEERLVACVNLVPQIQSIYRWEGKVETAQEALMIMKTPERNVIDLMRRIETLHSYSVPEILVLPVEAGLQAYLEWADKEAR